MERPARSRTRLTAKRLNADFDLMEIATEREKSDPRNVVQSPRAQSVTVDSAVANGLLAIAPWRSTTNATPIGERYPGRERIWRDLFPRVGFSAIKLWRHGHRPMPQWARDRLAAALYRRADHDRAIADALTKRKSPP